MKKNIFPALLLCVVLVMSGCANQSENPAAKNEILANKIPEQVDSTVKDTGSNKSLDARPSSVAPANNNSLTEESLKHNDDQDNNMVTGVGIRNGSSVPVTFYFSYDGRSHDENYSIGGGEARDYKINGRSVYIILYTTQADGSNKTQVTRLEKGGHYVLYFDSSDYSWKVG